MAFRPKSWVKNYDDVDFDISLGRSSSGRSSPHERQHMLADASSSVPLEQPSQSDTTPPVSTPPSPPPSHSRLGSTTPPDPRDHPSAHSPTEAGPSFLRMPRSTSFTSSPLNPAQPSPHSPFARPGSRGSAHLTRIASEESRALAMGTLTPSSPFSSAPSTTRASMILYRRVEASDDVLLPPSMPHAHAKGNRASMFSISGDSILSLSADSKYPFPERPWTGTGIAMGTHTGGLVAYAYDPTLDYDDGPEEEVEDRLHDPTTKDEEKIGIQRRARSWRGFKNLAALGVLIAALLCLFVVYPIIDNFRNDRRERMIVGNTRINATGQAEPEPFDSRGGVFRRVQISMNSPPGQMIDPSTPLGAKTRTNEDGMVYELIFSDEFELERRTFFSGDDTIWKASDDASYDPERVTTMGGNLVVRVDEVGSPSGPGNQSPNQNQDQGRDRLQKQKHKQNETPAYVSGRLHTRVPFCAHGSGANAGVYVEAGVVQPGGSTRLVWWEFGGWDRGVGDEQVQAGVLDLSLGIDVTNLNSQIKLPTELYVDYVRVFQTVGDGDCESANPDWHIMASVDLDYLD